MFSSSSTLFTFGYHCLHMSMFSSVFRPPPRKVRKHFLTRYTVKNGISNLYILLNRALKMQEMPFQSPKFQNGFSNLYILLKRALKIQEMPFQRPKFQNGISNLYILLKSCLKMQEMPFQRPKFQKISGGAYPQTPYNCVVTMASPSLKSWLRHCSTMFLCLCLCRSMCRRLDCIPLFCLLFVLMLKAWLKAWFEA